MLTRRPTLLLALLAVVLSVSLASEGSAETVIKFDLAGTPGPDISYSSNALGLIPDGNATVIGDKTTDLVFLSFLDFIPSILDNASMSLSGIGADGAAAVDGVIVSQATSGGSFSVWDDSNMLLLAGNVGNGVITGSTVSSTGGFFSTSPVLYTDGSLLPLLEPDSGAISLSLTNIRTTAGDTSGLTVTGGVLQDFTANAVGQLEASAVPEPSVLGMAAIGALVIVRRHRRRKAKTA